MTREEIVSQLLAEFPPEIVEKIEKTDEASGDTFILSNVAPQHYFRRIIDLLGGYASFSTIGGPEIVSYKGQEAVIVQRAAITINHPNFQASFEGVGAEPISKRFEWLAFKIKSATSDAFKIACKPSGLGLSLYNDNARLSEPASQQQSSGQQYNNTPNTRSEQPRQERSDNAPSKRVWDGELDITFGKHNGTKWNKVIGSWLVWAGGKPYHDAETDKVSFEEGKLKDKALDFARKEMARRLRAGTFDPEEGARNYNNGGGGGRGGYQGRGRRAMPQDEYE